MSGGGAAELAVSVRSPHGELPVRVTGNIHSGFTAEFTPVHVGAHTINVDYNGYPVHVCLTNILFSVAFILIKIPMIEGNAVCSQVLRCPKGFCWFRNERSCWSAGAIHS